MRLYRESQKVAFQAVSPRTGKIVDATRFPDAKGWVVAAISGESQRPEKRLWRNEPDPETASARRTTQVRRLKRHSLTNTPFVLKRLSYCSDQHRCFSGGCPECARLFQRALVRGVRRFFRKNVPKGHKLVAISLVPAEARIPPGDLAEFDIDNFLRRTKSKLKRAGLQVGIGAADFSFNQDRDGKYEAHWCPHVYIIGWTRNAEGLKKSLKKLFHADKGAVRKPTTVTDIEPKYWRISYAFKWQFQQRLAYFDAVKQRRNTDKLRLQTAHQVELCTFLDRVGLAKRLICLGLKPSVKDGRLELQQASL